MTQRVAWAIVYLQEEMHIGHFLSRPPFFPDGTQFEKVHQTSNVGTFSEIVLIRCIVLQQIQKDSETIFHSHHWSKEISFAKKTRQLEESLSIYLHRCHLHWREFRIISRSHSQTPRSSEYWHLSASRFVAEEGPKHSVEILVCIPLSQKLRTYVVANHFTFILQKID